MEFKKGIKYDLCLNEYHYRHLMCDASDISLYIFSSLDFKCNYVSLIYIKIIFKMSFNFYLKTYKGKINLFPVWKKKKKNHKLFSRKIVCKTINWAYI